MTAHRRRHGDCTGGTQAAGPGRTGRQSQGGVEAIPKMFDISNQSRQITDLRGPKRSEDETPAFELIMTRDMKLGRGHQGA
jgi:hypothetical protein